MSDQPLFTIITSTLNSAVTLERCLKSVAAQHGVHFEHLVADGASTDLTLTIVNRYLNRYPLHVACSEPDTGLYQAWNRAVQHARGQWVLFLGSDDYLLSSDALSRVAAAIVANPSLSQCNFLFTDTQASHHQPDWATYQENPFRNWLRGATEYPTSVFISARLFQQGFSFDESYRICADHKFFAEHRFFESACYIPVPLISFQKGGISSSPNYERLHYLERRRMLRELGRSRPLFTEWYYWLRARL